MHCAYFLRFRHNYFIVYVWVCVACTYVSLSKGFLVSGEIKIKKALDSLGLEFGWLWAAIRSD